MKIDYVESQNLPKGFRVKQYEGKDIVAFLNAAPANAERLADIANMYLRQKGPLVWGRDDLTSLIESTYGFKPVTKSVTKDGETSEVWDETEGEYISRFISESVKGKFAHAKLAVNGSDEVGRRASVLAALQSLADQCGEVDDAGKALEDPPCYVIDINKPVRVAKARTAPKWATEAATKIINAKNEDKWVKNFTNGRTTKLGVKITPFPFQPFNTAPAKGAKPEEVEAVRQTNIKNLALALVEDDRQVKAAAVGDYA